MEGKICIVTGASSGIGNATAKSLVQQGAKVIGIVRNPRAAEASFKDILSTGAHKDGAIILMKCDLLSQASIRQFSDSFHEEFSTLDVLINNAGAVFPKRVLNEDGVESTFATIVLAPFLLSNLLLDRLRTSEPSRIVNVTSALAGRAKMDFDNLQGEKKYGGWGQYGQSKLAL